MYLGSTNWYGGQDGIAQFLKSPRAQEGMESLAFDLLTEEVWSSDFILEVSIYQADKSLKIDHPSFVGCTPLTIPHEFDPLTLEGVKRAIYRHCDSLIGEHGDQERTAKRQMRLLAALKQTIDPKSEVVKSLHAA